MTDSELINKFLFSIHTHPVGVSTVCCLCNRRVHRTASLAQLSDNVQVEFRCHEAVEHFTIERLDVKRCLDVSDVLDLLPRRVFWPGFSRYSTTTKPPRRVL